MQCNSILSKQACFEQLFVYHDHPVLCVDSVLDISRCCLFVWCMGDELTNEQSAPLLAKPAWPVQLPS